MVRIEPIVTSRAKFTDLTNALRGGLIVVAVSFFADIYVVLLML